MPREAKLFASSSGSVVRGYLKLLRDLKKNRPRARSAIEHAGKALRALLNRWEIAYNKENFIAAYVFVWSCSGMVLRIYRWTAAAGV